MIPAMDAQLKTFIRKNIEKNTADLALQYAGKTDLPIVYALDQIKARQQAKQKLPSWYLNDDLIFPPGISIEQCSSERAAIFKSRKYSGVCFLDLTGGTGIDTLALSKRFKKGVYVEPSKELCELFKHNAAILNGNHIQINEQSAEVFLKENEDTYDLIYLDPSRRDEYDQRVYRLDACLPNCIELLPLLLDKSEKVLIKASPMLDIRQAIADLNYVRLVQTVAIDNEMKEVLLHIERGCEGETQIEAWNLVKENEEQSFAFTHAHEKGVDASYRTPQTFLYDVNVAIMKAGAFKSVAKQYNLKKLGVHTHLYTSENLIADFPGRVFKIEENVKPSKKQVLKSIPSKKVNVITRNYPSSTNEVKKKFNLHDGGDRYAFFCDVVEIGATCLLCSRIY